MPIVLLVFGSTEDRSTDASSSRLAHHVGSQHSLGTTWRCVETRAKHGDADPLGVALPHGRAAESLGALRQRLNHQDMFVSAGREMEPIIELIEAPPLVRHANIRLSTQDGNAQEERFCEVRC